jgi:hypothetical protein
MKRIEIHLSEAIEEDFEHLLEEKGVTSFTKLNPSMGRGCSTPMLNNDIWPGRNTSYIIYIDEEDGVKEAIDALRKRFPGEGIAAYLTLATEL